MYTELRRLAVARLSRERPYQTLQATALVHEAFLRLLGPDGESVWENRRHFFAAAAEAMRRILIENARRKGRQKRGGNLARTELHESQVIAEELSEDVLAVDEALTELEEVDLEAAELVKLRFYVGFSQEEAAEALEIPSRTADRRWAYARAWLHDRLSATE